MVTPVLHATNTKHFVSILVFVFYSMLQVLKETLRLYPTAPGTNRWLHEDMVINGLNIPGGCSVAVSIGSFCSHDGTGPGQLLVIQVQLLSI